MTSMIFYLLGCSLARYNKWLDNMRDDILLKKIFGILFLPNLSIQTTREWFMYGDQIKVKLDWMLVSYLRK